VAKARIDILDIALGVFLAVSESGEADVECFAADDVDGDPVDMPGCEYMCPSLIALVA
jgi:hypothetical protein